MKDLVDLRVSGIAEKPEIAGAVCRLDVPSADVARAFETRARVPVVATFPNGYVMRSSLLPRGGVHILPLRVEACEGADIRPGDAVTVMLRRDDEPRTIDVPLDLSAALRDSVLRVAFDAMSYSHRKEWVLAIGDAKREDTRLKRIRDCLVAVSRRASP